MRKYRFHLIFALCWATGSTLMSWLVASDDSPMHSSSPEILEWIAMLHFIPFILSYLVSALLGTIGPCGPSGTEAIYWGFGFLQWFVAGLVVACFISRLKGSQISRK